MEKGDSLGRQKSGESKKQSSLLAKYVCEKDLLGLTNLSKVYLAKETETGKTVVLKKMQLSKRDNGGTNDKRRKDIMRELELTKQAQSSGNKYLVNMIDADYDNGHAYLVLEYYSEGDLSKYLAKKPGNKLDEDQALSLFAKICEGYQWLAENDIVHRDLKPANIFMKDGDPIIGDFGKSRSYDQNMSNSGFSEMYMAPEQLSGDEIYGRGVDIWALGVILYEMVYGKYPFFDSNNKFSRTMLLYENPSFSADLKRTNTLLQGMMEKDPKIRISWSQVYSHVLSSYSKPQELQEQVSYSNPQELQEQISQLTDSVSFYYLAIQILSKCQSLKVKKLSMKFLPQNEFLFVACSFVRVALSKLQLANQYAESYKTITGEGLSSEKVKELNSLKEVIEDFKNDERWVSKGNNTLRSLIEEEAGKGIILSPLTIENNFKKDFPRIYELVMQSALAFEIEIKEYQQVVFQMMNSMHDLIHDSSGVCKAKKNVALLKCIAQFHDLSF